MSATTFSNPSDRRLKANVNSLEARAKHIFTLNGVSFNYKRKVINSSPAAARSTSTSSSPSSASQGSAAGESSHDADARTGGLQQRQLGAVSADGVVDTNSTYFGFIAQEVEGQFPELVGRDSQGFRSVQYSAFVPLIIEGMKEQRSDLVESIKDQRSKLAEGLKAQQSEIEGLWSQFREELREAGVLLSLPSPSATTTTRTVSVKGLSATGAVTAHHDLVHKPVHKIMPAAGVAEHGAKEGSLPDEGTAEGGKGTEERQRGIAEEAGVGEVEKLKRLFEERVKVAEERAKVAVAESELRAKVAVAESEERAKVAVAESEERAKSEVAALRSQVECLIRGLGAACAL
jgi:hypothetical protein